MKYLFIIISISLLTAFGNAESEEQDLTTHPFYNTLYGTDCTIPEGTEILHYPMIHPRTIQTTPEADEKFNMYFSPSYFESLVSYSSFHFIKLVEQHPSALIFSEKLASQKEVDHFIIKDAETKRKLYSTSIDDINNASSYEQLNLESLELLAHNTGVLAAFITGTIEHFYPSTNIPYQESFNLYWNEQGIKYSDVYKNMTHLLKKISNLFNQFINEKDPVKKKKLKETIYHNYKELKDLNRLILNTMFSDREKLVVESVENVISQMGDDKLVIINYGAFHDFSDDFKAYNFYTLPYACTMPADFISSDSFTILLADWIVNFPIDDPGIFSILYSELKNRDILHHQGMRFSDQDTFTNYNFNTVIQEKIDTWTWVHKIVHFLMEKLDVEYQLMPSEYQLIPSTAISAAVYHPSFVQFESSNNEDMSDNGMSATEHRVWKTPDTDVGVVGPPRGDCDVFESTPVEDPRCVSRISEPTEEENRVWESFKEEMSESKTELEDVLEPSDEEISESTEEKSLWESFKDWWNN